MVTNLWVILRHAPEPYETHRPAMPLESATYLDSLDPANPAATDLVSQGDDHLRLLKTVLKATFPNLTGAVTLTEAQLNALPASVTSGGVPIGVIAMWYGTSGTVPSGWAICNGQTVAKTDGSGNITTPDLRNLVVMGAGSVAPEQTAYGASTASATSGSGGGHTHSITADGAHSHNPTIGGTALTVSQLPAHAHLNGMNDTSPGAFSRGTGASAGGSQRVDTSAGGASVEGYTESIGSGATHTHSIAYTGTDGTHTHTASTEGAHTHGVTVSTYQPAMALHFILRH